MPLQRERTNLTPVGERYILLCELGSGSFGDVCKAIDTNKDVYVAIKCLKDVTRHRRYLKCVLREISIMTHLSHPTIIFVTDAFVGRCHTNNGLDLYIVTEFADRGSFHDLPPKLSEHEVKILMWQLLLGLEYMHSCHVWHRDIKPANVLLASPLEVKICDFNLARSTYDASAEYEEESDNETIATKKDFCRYYTKQVVTPNYRAPEVIMSSGQYTSAIDLWSVGCVFWELLLRSIEYADNEAIQEPIRPLFNLRVEVTTPQLGENFENDKDPRRIEQLNAIFNVIGTPNWNDIENIPCLKWRAYLKGVPGKSGNLVHWLTEKVDMAAIGLLSRLLTFNPFRRLTASEALAHEYFQGIDSDPLYTRISKAASKPSTASKDISENPTLTLLNLEKELGMLDYSCPEEEVGRFIKVLNEGHRKPVRIQTTGKRKREEEAPTSNKYRRPQH